VDGCQFYHASDVKSKVNGMFGHSSMCIAKLSNNENKSKLGLCGPNALDEFSKT